MNRRQLLQDFWGDFELLRRRAMGFVGAAFAEHDISHSQGLLLLVLAHHDGFGVTALADCFGITSSAATQLLDGLAKKGYVRREASRADRRALAIRLTPKARRFLLVLKKRHLDAAGQVLSCLNDRELAQYVGFVRRIVEQTGKSSLNEGPHPLQMKRRK